MQYTSFSAGSDAALHHARSMSSAPQDREDSSSVILSQDHAHVLSMWPTSRLHVVADKGLLIKALAHQQTVIERRGGTPILTHVLLRTGADQLEFVGTDLEMSLVEHIPVVVHEEGALTAPAHLLYDIVRKLPDGPIDLLFQNDSLQVSCGAIRFQVPTLLAKDFPQIHPDSLPFALEVSASCLKKIIEDTKFSMSTEEARYSLNGIYLHPHGDQWRAVATDAHRLALSSLAMDALALESAPCVIVGRKTIQEISKILGESTHTVQLSLSPQQLLLSFPGGHFSSRLLEGQFPDYWQAIPSDNPHSIHLDVQRLENAISRVSMVNSDRQRVIQLSFQPESVTLSAHSQQYGSATETLAIDYVGTSLLVGLNPKFLLDICHHIKGSQVTMLFKDSLSPVLFQDPADPAVSFVLMPTRVVS